MQGINQQSQILYTTCPSYPTMLETGTLQSSKITALVGWEFHPT